jgi:hypothetical protein
MTRDQFAVAIYRAFTAVLNGTGQEVLAEQHRDLLLAADQYAAHVAEITARPPDRLDRRAS